MTHRLVAVSYFVLGGASTMLVFFPFSGARAQVNGGLPAYVRLQVSTPGTPQTGHANITGTMVAGQFVGGGAALTGLSANNVTNGLLGSAFGGTGVNTVSTPAGSLLRTTSMGTWGTLPIGSDSQVLKSVSGAPQWGTDGLQLPYSAAFSGFVGISMTNTGALDVFDATIANSASPAECFQGTSNGTGDVVVASMTGLGTAGLFSIVNSANSRTALEASSSGSGYGLGAVMTGAGAAASFRNLALGKTVEFCGPNGAVDTNGFYYRDYTVSQRSAAVPIAYGSVSSTGVVNSGTGNFTVSHTVTGDYSVTVNGEVYSNTGYTVTVVPVSGTARMSCVLDGGTAVIVRIFDLTGTKVDTGFQFTIWRPDAVE